MMPDEVHMMRKEIYDSEGYTQRTSMPVWQARCAAQQPTRREHGLRANPVLRARTVALPFLFVLCVTDVWPSSSTRRAACVNRRVGGAAGRPLRTKQECYANIVKVTINSMRPPPCSPWCPHPGISPYARIRYTELCGIPPARPGTACRASPLPSPASAARIASAGGSSGPRARLLLRSHLTRTSRRAARLADARVGLACPRRAVWRARSIASSAPRRVRLRRARAGALDSFRD